MIIDCHGHHPTFPQAHDAVRDAQCGLRTSGTLHRRTRRSPTTRSATAARQTSSAHRDRGAACVSQPRASAMSTRRDEAFIRRWAGACNTSQAGRDLYRIPSSFIPLPQSPGVPIIPFRSRTRRRRELGFVGAHLNPDPSGGHWTPPPRRKGVVPPVREARRVGVPAMVQSRPAATLTPRHRRALPQRRHHASCNCCRRLSPTFPRCGCHPARCGSFRTLGRSGAWRHDAQAPPREHPCVLSSTRVYHPPASTLFTVIRVANPFGSRCGSGARHRPGGPASTFVNDTGANRALASCEARGAGPKEVSGNARRVYPRLDASAARRCCDAGVVTVGTGWLPFLPTREAPARATPRRVDAIATSSAGLEAFLRPRAKYPPVRRRGRPSVALRDLLGVHAQRDRAGPPARSDNRLSRRPRAAGGRPAYRQRYALDLRRGPRRAARRRVRGVGHYFRRLGSQPDAYTRDIVERNPRPLGWHGRHLLSRRPPSADRGAFLTSLDRCRRVEPHGDGRGHLAVDGPEFVCSPPVCADGQFLVEGPLLEGCAHRSAGVRRRRSVRRAIVEEFPYRVLWEPTGGTPT